MNRGIPFVDLLTYEQVEELHETSMTILEETGIEFRDDEAIALWRHAGADVDDYRVRIDRNHLMELIASAP